MDLKITNAVHVHFLSGLCLAANGRDKKMLGGKLPKKLKTNGFQRRMLLMGINICRCVIYGCRATDWIVIRVARSGFKIR